MYSLKLKKEIKAPQYIVGAETYNLTIVRFGF